MLGRLASKIVVFMRLFVKGGGLLNRSVAWRFVGSWGLISFLPSDWIEK